MPSLFRRKSADSPDPADAQNRGATEVEPGTAAGSDSAADPDQAAEAVTEPGSRSGSGSGTSGAVRVRKGYTPSKRERGEVTPKRRAAGARRVDPPPANRREAYKRMREKDKAERAERRQAMLSGDERYLLARDRGPERALVRDIVDARRTVGTWFFGGALVVLIGAQPPMPVAVRVGSNLLWIALAAGTIIDSLLISRRISKLVHERFPKTRQRPAGLYFYGIVRAMTFRRLRMPRPRIQVGQRP